MNNSNTNFFNLFNKKLILFLIVNNLVIKTCINYELY